MHQPEVDAEALERALREKAFYRERYNALALAYSMAIEAIKTFVANLPPHVPKATIAELFDALAKANEVGNG
jgi:hypothetical protein